MTMPPLPMPYYPAARIGMLTQQAYIAADMRAYGEACAAAERERAANIVDPGDLAAWEVIGGDDGLELMRNLAAAIRAQGETPARMHTPYEPLILEL